MSRLMSGVSRVVNTNEVDITQANYMQSHAGNRMSGLLKSVIEYGSELRTRFTYSVLEFREIFSQRISSLLSPNKLTGVFKPFNLIVGAGVIVFVIVYVFRRWTYVPPPPPLTITLKSDKLDPTSPISPLTPSQPSAPNTIIEGKTNSEPKEIPLQSPSESNLNPNLESETITPPLISAALSPQPRSPNALEDSSLTIVLNPINNMTNLTPGNMPLLSLGDLDTNSDAAQPALSPASPSSSRQTATTPLLVSAPSSPLGQPSSHLDDSSSHQQGPLRDSMSPNPSPVSTSSEGSENDESEKHDANNITTRRKNNTATSLTAKIDTRPSTTDTATSPFKIPQSETATSPMPATLTSHMATSPMPSKPESKNEDNDDIDEALELNSSSTSILNLAELVIGTDDHDPLLPLQNIPQLFSKTSEDQNSMSLNGSQSQSPSKRKSLMSSLRLRRERVNPSGESTDSDSPMSPENNQHDSSASTPSLFETLSILPLPMLLGPPSSPHLPDSIASSAPPLLSLQPAPPPSAPPLLGSIASSAPPPAPPLPSSVTPAIPPPLAPLMLGTPSDFPWNASALSTSSDFIQLGSQTPKNDSSLSTLLSQVKLRKTPTTTPTAQRSRAGSVTGNGGSTPNRTPVVNFQAQLAAKLAQRVTKQEKMPNSDEWDDSPVKTTKIPTN